MLLHQVGHRVGDRLRPAFRPPAGSMYAHMWRRSTTPVSSCSVPIGSWIATQRSESCSRPPRARGRSRRARGRACSRRRRARARTRSARFHTRAVLTSTPITPLSDDERRPRRPAAPRTCRPGSPRRPGESTRLIFRSFHSRWQSEPESDIARFCSCRPSRRPSCPARRVPSRLIFPAWKSSASTREVFPTPRWPATAMLRIFVGSVAGMRDVSSSVASSRIVSPLAWMKGAVHRPKIGACALSSALPCCSPSRAPPLHPTACSSGARTAARSSSPAPYERGATRRG